MGGIAILNSQCADFEERKEQVMLVSGDKTRGERSYQCKKRYIEGKAGKPKQLQQITNFEKNWQ